MEAVRGRSGGFRLSMRPQDVRIGEVVRALEFEVGLVECMRDQASDCPLIGGCRLPQLLYKATDAFFQVLDGCTLDDLTGGNLKIIQFLEPK